MTYSLTWLPTVLKAAGLKVGEEFGWQARGRGPMGKVTGVMCHHTADTRTGNMPSLKTLIHGRSDLAGPLAQLGLARDGTFYVIAAGRCNHAGPGEWKGYTSGNLHFIGVEAENHGTPSDHWPRVQMDAYVHGVAAILRHIGQGSDFCVGHKEWARNRTEKRKSDPAFDMNTFRSAVASVLNGATPPLALIPAAEPGIPGVSSGRPTLRRGITHPLVEQVQRALRVSPVNGSFGPLTEAAVRVFQRGAGMVADGIVGPRTWTALDEAASHPAHGGGGPQPPADALAWGAKVSPAFKRKIREISSTIGCDPNHLMACIAFESAGSFSPAARNPHSGATGLIQFMPATARDLGTSTDKLAAMSAEEQLEYVARYFSWHHGIRTLEDLYMAILWPRAIGKPDDYVLFERGTKAYAQNSGLDLDGDGRVTKFEAAAAVRHRLDRGLKEFLG